MAIVRGTNCNYCWHSSGKAACTTIQSCCADRDKWLRTYSSPDLGLEYVTTRKFGKGAPVGVVGDCAAYKRSCVARCGNCTPQCLSIRIQTTRE
jgi:hypothetical protein